MCTDDAVCRRFGPVEKGSSIQIFVHVSFTSESNYMQTTRAPIPLLWIKYTNLSKNQLQSSVGSFHDDRPKRLRPHSGIPNSFFTTVPTSILYVIHTSRPPVPSRIVCRLIVRYHSFLRESLQPELSFERPVKAHNGRSVRCFGVQMQCRIVWCGREGKVKFSVEGLCRPPVVCQA